jgi:hypothetical protein
MRMDEMMITDDVVLWVCITKWAHVLQYRNAYKIILAVLCSKRAGSPE